MSIIVANNWWVLQHNMTQEWCPSCCPAARPDLPALRALPAAWWREIGHGMNWTMTSSLHFPQRCRKLMETSSPCVFEMGFGSCFSSNNSLLVEWASWNLLVHVKPSVRIFWLAMAGRTKSSTLLNWRNCQQRDQANAQEGILKHWTSLNRLPQEAVNRSESTDEVNININWSNWLPHFASPAVTSSHDPQLLVLPAITLPIRLKSFKPSREETV